jgi:ATP-dependent DNA helicase PIF1
MYTNIKALKEKPETANVGMRWSEVEVSNLLNEIKDGKSFTDIANLHKRTLGSITSKLLHIAEQLINNDGLDIESVSKKVNLPIQDINQHLLKMKNKPETNKKKVIKEEIQIIEEKKKEIILNSEQETALASFIEGNNIFLTGPAGTGKSVTLKKMIEYCCMEGRLYGVTATTGSASFLIGGRTIHSYLGLGLAKDSAKNIFEYNRRNRPHIVKKLRDLKVLIIDEISMLDNNLFDKISEYLCFVRYNKNPFGGIQVVLTGDFCQLEPVAGDYCFKSDIWGKLNLNTIYLKKMIRQDGDTKFQKMLMKLRYGICSDKTFDILSELKDNKFTTITPTILYSKNYDVDKINNTEYQKLIKTGAETKTYEIQLPTIKKNKDKATTWFNALDMPEEIELCIGCQIVVLANIDQDNGIVNGTRGCIIELRNKSVIIKRVNGSLFEIEYHKNISIDDPDIFICYMPLKLAYALTIHKSQGMTLDAIEIDIGNDIFAAGQAYTALSRAQSLKSICIKSISKKSFITKDSVLEFYSSLGCIKLIDV